MDETKMTLDFGALERDGFCVANGISEGKVLDFVQHLGPIKVDPRNPEPVRDIRPQTAHVAKSNTLSSRYGVGSFPFHTDTAHWEHPTRCLVLFCVSPGEGGRPTLLLDSHKWRFDDAEEDLACQALWAIGHRRPRLSSIAVRSKGQLAIRYDMDCMRPMTADARKSKALLESRIYAKAEHPDPNRVPKRILIGEN
jgi:L-asparagine oxygenase